MAPTFAEIVNDSIVPFVDGALIPLLYMLAFVFLLFGILRFFFSEGEENREKGKKFIIWGLVGMVVIFVVWGIVNLLIGILAEGAGY